MNYFGFRTIVKRLQAIKYMMKDKKVPFWKKALVVAGLVYIVVPTDLIPFVVFPIAGLDDIIIFGGILYLLADTLDTYWYGEKPIDLSKKFSGKDVVEGVEYKVDVETDKDKNKQHSDKEGKEDDDE